LRIALGSRILSGMDRVAMYVRVSKDDGSQTTENQLPECEALAARRGTIVRTYSEERSAAKRRPCFDAMMADAREGAFDVLIIWAIDRFGRNLVGNLRDITALDASGIKVVSVREPWLDTTGPTRGLLLAIFSWMAEQERARLSDRTKAGLVRARSAGKRLGRPKTLRIDPEAVRAAVAAHGSVRAAARSLGLGYSAVQRTLAATRAA
jgi:putative DNA-invertase from lambdoid prophage Rac